MILNEWKPFGTDTNIYTQSLFEEEVSDLFEAMMLDDEKEYPKYIWTKNFVITIKSNSRMFKDVSFIKIPRNPSP